MKFSSDVAAAVTAASTRLGIDPYLLAAIVAQESGGDTWAMRYESAYTYLWDVELNAPFHGGLDPAKFPAPDYVSGMTEWMGQKTSFGCCQVMGAVARQQGFAGKFLTELCDPAIGIDQGAQLLAKQLERYKSNATPQADAVSAYNAGHLTPLNLDNYVKPVLAFQDGFRRTGY
jgi:soluble lytic murein transglycosylase-like protein